MNSLEHLTKIQINAYHDGSLSLTEQTLVGKHLLFCDACRESLPTPTTDRLQTAIFSDTNRGVIETKSETENQESFFFVAISGIRLFLSRPNALAVASGAFVILFGSLFTIWMITAPTDNSFVAQTNTEIASPDPFEKTETPFVIKPNDSNQKGDTARDKVRIDPKPKQKPDAQIQKLPRAVSTKVNHAPRRKLQNIAEVRGNRENCGEAAIFESEFYLKDSNIVFTWKKIPNAKNYHLYLSDDNEILIDEFETENETSFVSKKSLDPMKSYKWKIVATLENGQMVVGPSLKVTSNELQKNQTRWEKSKKTQVRCSEFNR